MEHAFDHLIVGAGMAASAAATALRQADATARIALLGEEPHPPYDRPPLSTGLWKNTPEADIWRPIQNAKATMQLGRRVVAIDRTAHTVRDDAGDTWRYRKLLLATGGAPRTLPFGEGFIYLRTLDDYRRLRQAVKPGARAVVIGGGFIGSEIAAALTLNGAQVTMLFPETAIGARAYPKALAESVTAYYRDRGVDVRAGVSVKGTAGSMLELTDGSTLAADVVVAGLGITPNVQLAQDAGLAVDNGIVVDAHLRTSDPDIYAAGDVAAFAAAALGRRLRVEHENAFPSFVSGERLSVGAPGERLRVEHENAALTMGERAGRCMAGQDAPYDELPYFYSDLFDLGYEAVGTLDARLQTVEQWVTPYREGVVYYLDGDRVRGVLLWNTWDQVEHARKLIAEPGPLDATSVRGRLPVT